MTASIKTKALFDKYDFHNKEAAELCSRLVHRPSPDYWSALDDLAAAIERIRRLLPEEANIVDRCIVSIEDEWVETVEIMEKLSKHLAAGSKVEIEIVGKLSETLGAQKRWRADPKGMAMRQVKEVWNSQHRPGGKFARDMAIKYQAQGIDISEGGIKNAITRWRKEDSGTR